MAGSTGPGSRCWQTHHEPPGQLAWSCSRQGSHTKEVTGGLCPSRGSRSWPSRAYTRERLEGLDAPDGAAQLLEQVDLLVDGPFLQDLPDRQRPWVGSTNERFHAHTDIYAN